MIRTCPGFERAPHPTYWHLKHTWYCRTCARRAGIRTDVAWTRR